MGKVVSQKDIVLQLEDKPGFVPLGLVGGPAVGSVAEPVWPEAYFVPYVDGDLGYLRYGLMSLVVAPETH